MLKKTDIKKRTICASINIEVFKVLQEYAMDKNIPISKLVGLILSEWVVKKKWKKEKV